MNDHPTMQAIAETIGVSKSTVSLSMRNDPRITVATRKRVQHAATKLGYRVNPVICQLMSTLRLGGERATTLYNVALVVPAGCEPTTEFRRGLDERLALSGRKTELFRLADVTVERLAAILRARGIEAAIVVGSELATDALAQSGQFCVRLTGEPSTYRAGFIAGILVLDQCAFHRSETLVC